MHSPHIDLLLHKYANRTASEAETEELFEYLHAHGMEAIAVDYIKNAWKTERPAHVFPPGQLESLADRVLAQIHLIPEPARVHFLKTAWFRYAAMLILIAGAATFLYKAYQGPQKEITLTTIPSKQDILPGSDKAILTLAGGEQIRLDSNASVLLAAKGITNRNAQISYTSAPAIATINILTTPRGGQYKLKLPDGTMVWLNAATSITYPTVFVGGKREVLVNGEAYFEVATDTKKPFIVNVDGKSSIEVLGTSFNVNSYRDEASINTTLLEGSVKVRKENEPGIVLKPGQQAVVTDKIILNNHPDIGQTLAWKNGVFNFNRLTVPDALRQLAKWYDVEVNCSPALADKRFGGEMPRDLTLNQVIRLLDGPNIHFKLKGRTLVVTP